MKVQDVMTRNVKSCRPETNLAAAASMMWDYDCGVLPVVDEAGQVCGMITDRDIAIAAATRGRPVQNIAVGEVCSGAVFTSSLDEDLTSALKTMQQQKVRRLPVLDGEGKLQGILSLGDITLRTGDAKGKQVSDITYEDVVNTYKAIRAPRPLQQAVALA